MYITSRNPYSNEILKEYDTATDEQIEKKIDSTFTCFQNYKSTAFSFRKEKLLNAAQILEVNKQKYGLIITREMGKVIKESIAEVEKCALVCRYYAENGERFLSDQPLKTGSGNAFVSYHPLGVVLAVMPWNFPFWQVFRFAAPALMAGNTCLLKHASNVPQCALAIQEVFEAAGFPLGAFNSLLIPSSVVNKVIEDRRIAAVTLTGSEGAGSAVAACSGKNIKKTVLELGGSDPFIVLKDADLEHAASVAAKARMLNCGQSCIAAKRFIVEQSVATAFKKSFFKSLHNLKYGNPEDAVSDFATMASEQLARELHQQVIESVGKGAKVVFGEVPDKVESAFYPIIVLENPPQNTPAYKDELFGPVASLFTVKDEKEAIELANDCQFGLGGSVWTADVQRGLSVAKKVESGAVYVNKMMASDPTLPFGGIKKSGYGRELSHLGIREFTNQKTIWVA